MEKCKIITYSIRRDMLADYNGLINLENHINEEMKKIQAHGNTVVDFKVLSCVDYFYVMAILYIENKG